MSKQLALSIALSVLAMTAFVLFGRDGSGLGASDSMLRLPISAQGPALPAVTQLLPSLQ